MLMMCCDPGPAAADVLLGPGSGLPWPSSSARRLHHHHPGWHSETLLQYFLRPWHGTAFTCSSSVTPRETEWKREKERETGACVCMYVCVFLCVHVCVVLVPLQRALYDYVFVKTVRSEFCNLWSIDSEKLSHIIFMKVNHVQLLTSTSWCKGTAQLLVLTALKLLLFMDWNYPVTRRGGNGSSGRKPMATCSRKCGIWKLENSSPEQDSNLCSSTGDWCFAGSFWTV